MVRLSEHGGVFGGGGGKGGSINVFTQLHEPDKKEGIWIKVDRKFDEVMMTDDVYDTEGGPWEELKDTPIRLLFDGHGYAQSDEGIHIISRYNEHCKYNPESDSWEQLPNIPRRSNLISQINMTFHKGDLFAFYSDTGVFKVYKYNVVTATWRELRSIATSSSLGESATISYKDYIYIMAGEASYRYSPETETYTVIEGRGAYPLYRMGDALLKSSEYFDLRTEEWKSSELNLSEVRGRSTVRNHQVFYSYRAPTGSVRVLFLSKNLYSGRFESYENVPSMNSTPTGILIHNNFVYVSYQHFFSRYQLPSPNVQQNTLVIFRGGVLYNNDSTEISTPTPELSGNNVRLDVPFTTAQLYYDGELHHHPVYYGTGTAWKSVDIQIYKE